MSIGKYMAKNPVTIAGDVKLGDGLEIMRSMGMRHLPVVEDEQVIGVISERDIFKHLYLKGPNTPISDGMSSNPYVVNATDSLKTISKVMAKNKIGCAIVKDNLDHVIGIFTTTDALFVLHKLLSAEDSEPFKLLKIEDYFQTEAFAV